jgi:hypothetical protein
MSEELSAAVQAVQVTSQIGFEAFTILVKSGVGLTKTMIKLISWMYHRKTSGETGIRRLLAIKGDDLQVFRFREADMPKVREQLEAHGILYTVLEDLNRKDGYREVMFASSSVSRIKEIAENMKQSSVIGFDDYVNNADPKDLREVMKKVDREMSEQISERRKTKGEAVPEKEAGSASVNFHEPPEREAGFDITPERMSKFQADPETGSLSWRMDLTPDVMEQEKKEFLIAPADDIWKQDGFFEFMPHDTGNYRVVRSDGTAISEMSGAALVSKYFMSCFDKKEVLPARDENGKVIDFTGFLDRQEFSYMAQQPGMKKVSFLESDIVAEQGNSFTLRLPPKKTGDTAYYATFLKKGTMAAEGGKVYTLLDSKGNYLITDVKGEPVTALRGMDIRKEYFDEMTGMLKRTQEIGSVTKDAAKVIGADVVKEIRIP